MIKGLNTVVEKHLQSLHLSPELVKTHSENASLWHFQLASDIEAELLCRIHNKNDIALTIIVNMDVGIEETLINAYVMAMAQVSSPVVFSCTDKSVSIRLQVQSDLASLNALISEAIIVCRQRVGALFLGALELEEDTLYETIEVTLERLQSNLPLESV